MFDLDLFRVARSMPHPSPGQQFAQLITPWGERIDPDRLVGGNVLYAVHILSVKSGSCFFGECRIQGTKIAHF